MATRTNGKAQCILCGKERSAVRCEGCLQMFCYNHLMDHRQELNKKLDEVEVNRDIFRETLTHQTTNLEKHTLIQKIDQWKEDSIKKIVQTAEEYKQVLRRHTTENITQVEVDLNKLTDELRHIRQENDFNEIDLSKLSERLKKLTNELDQPRNIYIQQDAASPVNKISIIIPSTGKDKELLENLSQQQHINYELSLNEVESLRTELNEKKSDIQSYTALKVSFNEMEKRCLKHKEDEIEAKQQLTVYQNFINDLQREIQDLTENLSAGAEEYKKLARKYTILQDRMERNHHENKSVTATKATSTSVDDTDIRECPLCYWQFPDQMTLDHKREHIENHFA